MATNEPLVPSMIFRSRTTKASSNVTEQKAWRRSLLSSMSLIRTSVITTVVLLYFCGTIVGGRGPRPQGLALPARRRRARPDRLRATPNQKDACPLVPDRPLTQFLREPLGLAP